MMKLSDALRSVERGHSHWCPACEEMHLIPSSWQFDGNVESPTFTPSVRITYNGPDAGKDRGDLSRAPYACCHYNLSAGRLVFHDDSTHPYGGCTVPLPPIPSSVNAEAEEQ